jgi:methionine-gamma-lyase
MPRNDDRHIAGRRLQPASLMMTYGYKPELSEGALKSPIFQTSTFVFRTAEEGKAFFEVAYGLREKGPGEETGLIYSRLNNPDLEILQDRLTLWDDAEAASVFESGMAAIATTLFAFARPDTVVFHSGPLYGGTDHLLNAVFPEFGIQHHGFVAGASEAEMNQALDEAMEKGRISAIFIETPANPTNALVDIEACSRLADRAAAAQSGERPPLIVDNTFLGPVFQRPLQHGADLVIYSATKFLGGHSDVIAGACLGSNKLMEQVTTLRTFFGTMCSPWTGWLLMRSLETLELRMTKQKENAIHVADYLAAHPGVRKVHYLSQLEHGSEQHSIYERQCLAPGSLIAFDVEGGEAEAFRLLNSLRLIKLAVSLGGTESLAEHPATMTHSDIPVERQAELGITPSMIRLSVGVEDPGDLVTDLGQALSNVTGQG